MAGSKTIYFDFYQCEVIASQHGVQQRSMDNVFSILNRQYQDEDANTVKTVRGKSFELRIINPTGYGFRGVIGKYRVSNLPNAAVPGGDEREIELGENEGLLEKCYFKYFSDYSLLVIQRNRYAINSGFFAKYLSFDGYTVSLNPVIQADDLRRLMLNEVHLRALTLKVARPTNPDLFRNVEHDFNNSIIQSLNSSNAATVNIVLRGDGHSSDPEQRYLNQGLKRAVLELKNRFNVKKAQLLLEEGGYTHPLDLVTDRLSHNVGINIERRYPVPTDMWDALMESRNAKEDELANYFGELDGDRLR